MSRDDSGVQRPNATKAWLAHTSCACAPCRCNSLILGMVLVGWLVAGVVCTTCHFRPWQPTFCVSLLSLSLCLFLSLSLSLSRPLCLSTSLSTSLSPDWRYTNAMVVKIEVIGLRHDALFHTARHAAQVRRQTDACLIGCDAAPCSSSSLLLLLPAGFAGCSTYKQSASETLMSPAQT